MNLFMFIYQNKNFKGHVPIVSSLKQGKWKREKHRLHVNCNIKMYKNLKIIMYNFVHLYFLFFVHSYFIINTNKQIKFIRISAKEYIYGISNKKLQGNHYFAKMRMAPSIDDLIKNAYITYSSPLMHKNNLFPNGFNNYQGKVGIDNNIFQYIVRIGKNKNNESIFYDVYFEFVGQKNKVDNKVLGGKPRH